MSAAPVVPGVGVVLAFCWKAAASFRKNSTGRLGTLEALATRSRRTMETRASAAPVRRGAGVLPNHAADTRAASDMEATVAYEAVPDAAAEDRRTFSRHAYPYKQHIAVCEVGESLPPWEEFFDVRCADLSSVGISFYLDDEPEFESIAVALGRFPYLRFMIAQVVRVEPADDESPGTYLVGCRFIERIW